MNADEYLENIQNQLYDRIFSDTTREVFAISDFYDMGERFFIQEVLKNLVKKHDNFFEISDKIYHRSRWIQLMKCWAAAPERECVDALMRYYGEKILITGAIAANALHFSTQVPARIAYITDGITRTEKVGPWKVEFQHADEDVMFWSGHPAAIVIQALSWMEEGWINSHQDLVINRLQESRFARQYGSCA